MKKLFTVKTIVKNNIIIVIRWGEDSKVFVSYLKLFDQEAPSYEKINELFPYIDNFCKKNQLILWSY